LHADLVTTQQIHASLNPKFIMIFTIDIVCIVVEMPTATKNQEKQNLQAKMTLLNQKLKKEKLAEQCKICENCKLPTLNPQN